MLVQLFSPQIDCQSIFHKHIGNSSLLGLTIKIKREKIKRERMEEKEKGKNKRVQLDLGLAHKTHTLS